MVLLKHAWRGEAWADNQSRKKTCWMWWNERMPSNERCLKTARAEKTKKKVQIMMEDHDQSVSWTEATSDLRQWEQWRRRDESEIWAVEKWDHVAVFGFAYHGISPCADKVRQSGYSRVNKTIIKLSKENFGQSLKNMRFQYEMDNKCNFIWNEGKIKSKCTILKSKINRKNDESLRKQLKHWQ